MASEMQFFGAVIALAALVQSVQSVSVDGISDRLVESLHVQTTMGYFLEGKLAQGVSVFVETAADTEMGSDIGTDVGVAARISSNSSNDHDPKTLEEYCAGPTAAEMHQEIQEKQRIEADWRGYGTRYPGVVTKKHRDGSCDILYDDGFTEKRVRPEDMNSEEPETKSEKSVVAKPRDDPACELQEFVKGLREKYGKLSDKLSQWLLAQRARVAEGKAPEPPPSMVETPPEPAPPSAPAPAAADVEAPAGVVAPAPAAAGPEVSSKKAEELEKLKEQLAKRDEYIKQLEQKAKKNEEALQKKRELDQAAAPPALATKTVDDLINQYRQKIAERDRAIEDLKRKIQQQEMELARLGAGQISLREIEADVQDLSKDAEKVQNKRVDLAKRGKLDDELRVIVDGIVKSIEKMQQKVARLIELEGQAKERKAAAEREVEEAERRAREVAAEQAHKEGKSTEEVEKEVAVAVKAARLQAEKEGEAADLETLKAAQEVEEDLKEAEKSTTQLDTGLHPHGKKWWRYRYEHSYIEAAIMIFIVILYLIWNVLVRQLKDHIFRQSLPPGASPKTVAEEISEESHGGVCVQWLHLLAEQMMVCIMVFLTVWTIVQTPLIHVVPHILTPSKDMHVPQSGDEYRVLALDITTIFFFAVMFYYGLMLSVAHESSVMTEELEAFEDKGLVKSRSSRGLLTSSHGLRTSQHWEACKTHFKVHIRHEMEHITDKDHECAEIQRLLGGDFEKFPLWQYLRLSIRNDVVADLFTMSWALWLPVVLVFLVFMCLHRYAHMGYVRIMCFFGLFLLGIILGMARRVSKASSEIEEGVNTPRPGLYTKTVHNMLIFGFNTESVVLNTLQFALFFICYGVARTICQSWMWELHFWPVLGLTILAIVSVLLFVFLMAPAIPSYCALMALPPYVDPHNIKVMLHVAQEVKDGKHDNLSSSRAASDFSKR